MIHSEPCRIVSNIFYYSASVCGDPGSDVFHLNWAGWIILALVISLIIYDFVKSIRDSKRGEEWHRQ